MEFKYRTDQNQMTTSLTPHPFSIVPCLSKNSLGSNALFSLLPFKIPIYFVVFFLIFFKKDFLTLIRLYGMWLCQEVFLAMFQHHIFSQCRCQSMSMKSSNENQKISKYDENWRRKKSRGRYLSMKWNWHEDESWRKKSQEKLCWKSHFENKFLCLPIKDQAIRVITYFVSHFPFTPKVDTKQPIALSNKDKNVCILVSILASYLFGWPILNNTFSL